jgi:hypothetical protein
MKANNMENVYSIIILKKLNMELFNCYNYKCKNIYSSYRQNKL